MDSGSSQSGPPNQRKRWVISLGAVALVVGGAWGARLLALHLATKASVRTLQEISESLPELEKPGEGAEEDLLFPLWPLDSIPEVEPAPIEKAAQAAAAQVEKKSAPRNKIRKKAVKPILGPTPKNARASIKRVLGWASKELVPQGISREAGNGMPAGIELYGAGVLGIGLMDGDRLVTVDGVSVLDRGQVIGAVLGARSRRAESMVAGLVRRTKEGPVEFTVVVEQPYPEHVEQLLPKAAPTDPPSEEHGGEPAEERLAEETPTDEPQ